MTCIASGDWYAPRTCSITASSVGSAATAGARAGNRRTRQRHISKDLEARRFQLAGDQVLHANLPTARRVAEGYRDQSAGPSFGREQISGVVTDGLPGWIHHVD